MIQIPTKRTCVWITWPPLSHFKRTFTTKMCFLTFCRVAFCWFIICCCLSVLLLIVLNLVTVALNGFGFWFHKLVVSKYFNMISKSDFVKHVRNGLILKLDVKVDIKVVFR